MCKALWATLHGAGEVLAFFDDFWLHLVNVRVLKHAPDNL